MSLRQKTLSGLSWSVVSQIGRQGLTFVIGIILARLLSPEEFGLIAMVTVFTGFATLFADFGLGAAIIQEKEVNNTQLSSIFWINVIAGITLTMVFILASKQIGIFYNRELLVPITKLVAFNFTISSIGIVHRALFSKEIDFKSLAKIEIVSILAGGISAVTLALLNFGVWSLVYQSLITSAVSTIGVWLFNSWRPSFAYNFQEVRKLLSFSINLLGERTINYWVRNTDNLLIGKVLGSSSLGLYSKAYNLMLFPLRNISGVITRVMFPSMAAIKEDRARVGRIFLKVTRVIALITFPMMVGCIIVADNLVITLFGIDWVGMIPILRILSVVGLIQSVVTVVGSVFLSQGRADMQFRLGLIIKPVLIIGIVAGLNWGVEGVAIGYACAVTFAQYINIKWAGNLVGVSYMDMLKNLSPIALWTVVMGLGVTGFSFLLPGHWANWLQLVLKVFVGVTIYSTCIHLAGTKAYIEAYSIVLSQIRRKS